MSTATSTALAVSLWSLGVLVFLLMAVQLLSIARLAAAAAAHQPGKDIKLNSGLYPYISAVLIVAGCWVFPW